MAAKHLLLMLISTYSVHFMEACSCSQVHPQTLFCNSDFVMQARLRGKPEDIYKKEAVTDEGGNSNNPIINRMKVAIKYNVKIRRMFKVNDNDFGLKENSTVTQLYTAPFVTLCGVDLQERTNYLLSGKFSNGQPHIDICSSLHLPWEWVTKIQRKGLRFTYSKNCDCKVLHKFDRDVNSTNTCKWDEYSQTGDCYKRQTVCIHDKNSSTGGCKWQRNSKLRKCRHEKKFGGSFDP